MKVDAAIAQRAERMVADCGLDTASIFVRDRAGERAQLHYLHHVGVADTAQRAYRDHRVFESDPFAAVADADGTPGGGMIPWHDPRIARAIGDADDYRGFTSSHGVDVVGAHVQRLSPGVALLIGVHCRPGGHARGDVAFARLDHDIALLAGQVAIQLLRDILTLPLGHEVLARAFDAGAPPDAALSAREREIARLVCAGQRNKQIAWTIGLSEFTVENHLRRIYGKLSIHNRAALVARLSGTLH